MKPESALAPLFVIGVLDGLEPPSLGMTICLGIGFGNVSFLKHILNRGLLYVIHGVGFKCSTSRSSFARPSLGQ